MTALPMSLVAPDPNEPSEFSETGIVKAVPPDAAVPPLRATGVKFPLPSSVIVILYDAIELPNLSILNYFNIISLYQIYEVC